MVRQNSGLVIGAITMTLTAGCGGGAKRTGPIDNGPGQVHPALQMMPVPGGLGVNIHFYKGNDKDLSMLAEAGVGIVRMDVGWDGCEKTPGQYDFSHYDQLISDLERRNIRLLLIIDYGNKHYDEGLAPHSERCRAAYARFCAALAGRYAGKKIIWELWNEPNIGFWKPKPNIDDYMAWCKAVVPAIRRADPKACIIAPATSGIPMPFLDGCFKRGLLELVDGVSVHPYRSAARGPETAIREYKRLASLIERYRPAPEAGRPARAIPVLSGEWGYTTTEMPREQQGKYLPRQWLTNMACDIPISIWYDWHDDGRDPKEREHNFGTVTWDYKPKPAYIAMKVLIAELRGYMPVGRMDVGDKEDFVVAFRRGDAFKLAVWTMGRPHEVDLGPNLKVTRAVAHLGRSIDVPAGSRQPVDDGPRYLTLATPVPGWLEMMPVRIAPVRPAVAGRAEDVRITMSLSNPTDRPARVTLHPVEADGVEGTWQASEPLVVAPGESRQAIWRGTVFRRDLEVVEAKLAADLELAPEPPYRLRRTAEVPILNPLALRLAWRHDGLQITVASDGDVPLRGRLIPRVDGVDRRAVPVAIDPPANLAEVRLTDVDLTGVRRHVGVRLVDEAGRLLAKVEPMTYELVHTIDAPVGTDITRHYRLWHEGDQNRKVKLSGTIVWAPGEDAPFPRAARIDYDMAAGWCFWQLGPKGQPQIGPGRPRRIMLWVRGDGSGDAVRCRVVDGTGQTFQPNAGTLDLSEWRWMEMSLEAEGGMGCWGGAGDRVMHLPLRWTSYYLQDSTKKAHSGTTYLTGVVVAW